LSDEQIAAISNYVLTQFGNPAARVSAADVAVARQGGPSSPLVAIAPYAVATVIVFIGVALVAIVFRLRRRQARRGSPTPPSRAGKEATMSSIPRSVT